ncbi:MAG: Holliday junction resolvase RuvX, partial [Deltaproteobacteria bacterium]|nr:Holliday junction resolvase RuvX [Deltaproteobacteria bacterium]
DESYSSREAEAILLEADLGRKKRKKIKDKLAAALILQKFLDEK